jgi:uncharacterized protein
MARPKKPRVICEYPKITGFRPYSDYAETIELNFDEYEAFRLIDKLEYTQEECAKQMKVARSTVAAIYDSAREKIANAIVYGKAINFHGGDIELCKYHSTCCGRCGQKDCIACGKCGKNLSDI